MAANEILVFSQANGANVLSQAAYAADAQRPTGNQPGIARAPLVNKAALQASAVAAGVAQFLADRQNADVTDQLTPADFAAIFANAIGAGAVLAAKTVYVSLGGSDTTGDGTIGNPWRTINHASQQVSGLNSRWYTVTIKCADGAYGEDVSIVSDNTILEGNVATPANCTTTSVYAFGCAGARVTGFDVLAAGTPITAERAELSISSCVVAGRLFSIFGSTIIVDGPLSTSGNQAAALLAHTNAAIRVTALITVVGNPTYTDGFAEANLGGVIWFSTQPTGAAVGPRYLAASNGVINTQGGGAGYLPGNAGGSTATGGQYV